jgi:hypothetical protein
MNNANAMTDELVPLVREAGEVLRKLRLAWESHCPLTIDQIHSRTAFKRAVSMEREINQCLKKLDK